MTRVPVCRPQVDTRKASPVVPHGLGVADVAPHPASSSSVWRIECRENASFAVRKQWLWALDDGARTQVLMTNPAEFYDF